MSKPPSKRSTEKRPQGAAYRHSRQRDRILEILRSTKAHPTAGWVYEKLRHEFPDLSLGTVYRNIGILAAQGLISRLDFGSTFDRLDANMKDHYHFVCDRCGSISDLDIPVDPAINRKIAGRGFEVRRHEIEFHGLCPACAKSSAR